jgi:RNA polymerase sigma factor (sigma-70 family)
MMMSDLIPLRPTIGPYDSDAVNEILVEHDLYIQAIARLEMTTGVFADDVLDLETDELIQNVRVTFWDACRKRSITSPRTYIKYIARTKFIDMLRRHKPLLSLYANEDEEPSISDCLVARNEGLRDPGYEVEREEVAPEFLKKLVLAVLSLPPRQRLAMLCSLKERGDEVLPLTKALELQGVDIKAINPPADKSEANLLKASLPAARKKLHWLLKEFEDLEDSITLK